MKKLWKYRFYILIIIGLALIFTNIKNLESNLKLILWGTGMFISYVGVLFQLIIAPNYNKTDLKCPDCGADLKSENNKLKFVKHNT